MFITFFLYYVITTNNVQPNIYRLVLLLMIVMLALALGIIIFY